ncbi:MAG: alpha/beta hydrolase [Acidobacteriia bacterium]|nr:alpha/beta hydrolase [Terriglobia bacterium]
MSIAWHVLAILGVLLAIFLFGVVPWFFTNLATRGHFHYPDPNDGKTPVSYGLNFRWVEFPSTDGIPLRGWYIPAPRRPQGTIIYCHGLNRTRTEMLPMAAFANALGYDGLLFDFRHSGQSGGDITTLGYQERYDVLGAVRFALAEEKAARPVVVWGVSMGAAAALMAAADSEEIAGVISDSTFRSFSDTVKHHLKLFLHLPAFPLAYEVIYWVAWRGGFSASDFDLEKAVDRISPRPILFVAVEGDRRMPPSIAEALYARASGRGKRILIVPGRRHGEGFNEAREPYEKAVEEFLKSLGPDEVHRGE